MRAADNPFEMTLIESLPYRMSDRAWSDLEARLHAHEFRGALVGPHGSGKTTLLETLAPRLAAVGLEPTMVRFYDRKRQWTLEDRDALRAANHRAAAVLIDGGEVLSLARWILLRQMTRHAGALIITSHREGRLPTIHRCTTNTQLLSDVAHAIAPAHAPAFASEYDAIFHAHDGNIRNALRHLYDRCAVL